MSSTTTHTRSWIWGAVTLLCGLGLYVYDDWCENLHIAGFFKELLEYLEITVMGPAMAALAFLASEQLYAKERMHAVTLERERDKRFHFLGRIAASMAHEVRNPLHNLHLLNNELRMRLSPENQELSDDIRGNLDRLDHATMLIYELARPQGNVQPQGLVAIDLFPLLRAISDELQGKCPRPAQMSLLEPEVPVHATARLEGLRIILQNLVRNAIEAADGGMVEISLPVGASGARVMIRNSGELNSDLIEEATTLDSTKPGGLGVGLAISRYLARLYGGQIAISQTQGWVVTALDLPSI
jgi:signal transduction histidine kinase